MNLAAIELQFDQEDALHGRPAALLVKTANRFPCKITLSNLANGKGPANARSITGLLALGVTRGARLLVRAEGEQADDALAALRQVFDSGFAV